MSLVLANIDTFCKTIEKLIHREHFVAIGREGRPEGFGTKSWDEKTCRLLWFRAVRQNPRYVYLYFLHRDKFGTKKTLRLPLCVVRLGQKQDFP